MPAQHQASLDHRSTTERFEREPAGEEQEFEKEYLAAAQRGSHIAIMRARTSEVRHRVWRILIEHGGSAIRFYHRASIEEL